MKYISKILWSIPLLLLLSQCAKVNSFQEPPDFPVIDSLSPASGMIGTQVRLWGSGFSTNVSQDTVRINGVLVRVDSPSTSTVLLVTILDSTGTGHVTVSVKGRSAEGPIFTWLGGNGNQQAPVITKADYGWADGSGYAVYVASLPPTDNGIQLFEGGVQLPITHITRPGTPNYDAALGYRILVSNNDEEAVENAAVDIYANFQVRYSNVPSNIYPLQLRPKMVDITSRHGEYAFTAGDTIKITGNFFGAPTLPSSLKIVYNGLPLTAPAILSWSNKEIRAIMPAYPTVPVGAGIPISIIVGTMESTPLACRYLGTASATVTLLAGSTQGFAEGSGGAAQFNSPAGIAVDGSGNVFVADQMNNRIRKITSSGVVTTVAGSATAGFQDGAIATALFNQPAAIGIDETGALYVADFINNRIRVIGNGIVGTLAGDGGSSLLWYPTGVALNNHNTVYVADMNNNRIRLIINATLGTPAGGTQGFADGTGPAARFNGPYGVALAADGTVYIADAQNHAIRKMATGGVVTTLAGGTEGTLDGTGTDAQFKLPRALALDAQGNIYVADFFSPYIRKITPQGVVTTIAGVDASGTNQVGFIAPAGIAVDAQGTIYVSDAGNHQIYKLKP